MRGHADSIFVGDAETAWATVIEDARRGALKPRYDAKPGGPQDRRDHTARHLQGQGLLPISLLQFTPRLPFRLRLLRGDQIFRQEALSGARSMKRCRRSQRRSSALVFSSTTTSPPIAWPLKELCRALIPMRVNWVSQASLDVTSDREAMQLMVDAGCLGHIMGFESITRASIKEARKSPNMPKFDQYATQIRILREYGLQTWRRLRSAMITDTVDSVRATLDFALENRFTFAAFNILMPYPNTPLYERLTREGRHLYDGQWWLHPKYRFNDASFVPARMTPDELTAVCYEARKAFNRIPALLWRFSDLKTNMRTAAADVDLLAFQSGCSAARCSRSTACCSVIRPLLRRGSFAIATRVRGLSICRSGAADAACRLAGGGGTTTECCACRDRTAGADRLRLHSCPASAQPAAGLGVRYAAAARPLPATSWLRVRSATAMLALPLIGAPTPSPTHARRAGSRHGRGCPSWRL